MTAITVPAAVTEFLSFNQLGDVVSEDVLEGGAVNSVRLLSTDQSFRCVLKECLAAPEDMYPLEANGLNALRVHGGPCVPEVYSVGPDHILLEALNPKKESDGAFWVDFGRAIARLHNHNSPLYGFHEDNYLGRMKVDNTWSNDGAEFFVRTRLRRFYEEPLCQSSLEPEDKRQLERLLNRIPQLIPFQPASLLHGDLWIANMLSGQVGEPAVIDPAVYYGWPETELAMTWQYGDVPKEFFAGYQEVRPLEAGWEERFEILSIKDYLSMLAHLGITHNSLERLRRVLEKYA